MFKTFSPTFLLIGALGFFSGLPLALTASTLTAWLADAQVDRASIGLFAAIATPYAFKFLWAPLMDGVRLPLLGRLGRRRGWLLLTQCFLVAAIAAMAGNDPAVNQWLTALLGVIAATLSATQDIVIDAYRVERLAPEEQGTGAGWVTFGYRIGMLVSGAGALYLADRIGWHGTYMVMAGIMASSLAITVMAKEPALHGAFGVGGEDAPATAPPPSGSGWNPTRLERAPVHVRMKAFLRDYVIAPFRDFMTRPQWLAVLAFVILYKLGDAFMGTMFNPFLLDLGFTKTEIAKVVKLYGLVATLLGTFAGGWVVARIGMFRALLLCGFGHMLTNFLLVVQARLGADVGFLTVSIVSENFTGGMSSAAFIAYLGALCRVNYTATQYALLSSLAAFGRTWLSTPSGAISKALGWEWFFAMASLMAVPSLLLLTWLEKKKRHRIVT